jgi:hypothetical protein
METVLNGELMRITSCVRGISVPFNHFIFFRPIPNARGTLAAAVLDAFGIATELATTKGKEKKVANQRRHGQASWEKTATATRVLTLDRGIKIPAPHAEGRLSIPNPLFVTHGEINKNQVLK